MRSSKTVKWEAEKKTSWINQSVEEFEARTAELNQSARIQNELEWAYSVYSAVRSQDNNYIGQIKFTSLWWKTQFNSSSKVVLLLLFCYFYIYYIFPLKQIHKNFSYTTLHNQVLWFVKCYFCSTELYKKILKDMQKFH